MNLNLDFAIKPETAKILNQQTFSDYYSRLRLLALSIFEWEGLPDSISVRYLESALFEQGRVFFFQDPSLGHLCLRGGPDSSLNVYGDPLKVRVNGNNGYNRELEKDAYIMIRNNFDTRPTEPTLRLYAQRLAQAERSLDTNINAQRTPLLIICEEKQRLTLKNVYSQYVGNEPVIYADKSMNPDLIKSIDTKAPYVADKLMLYKKDLWNEVMNFLGINTPGGNAQKAERMVVPEVESNNQLVNISAQVMLLTRKQAAEEISSLFGLNVSVRMREQPDPDAELQLEEQEAKEQEVASDE